MSGIVLVLFNYACLNQIILDYIFDWTENSYVIRLARGTNLMEM